MLLNSFYSCENHHDNSSSNDTSTDTTHCPHYICWSTLFNLRRWIPSWKTKCCCHLIWRARTDAMLSSSRGGISRSNFFCAIRSSSFSDFSKLWLRGKQDSERTKITKCQSSLWIQLCQLACQCSGTSIATSIDTSIATNKTPNT